MKKWVMLFMVCFLTVAAFAQATTQKVGNTYVTDREFRSAEYTPEELMQKVKNMELISYNRMPQVFWYLAGDEYLSDQNDINVFYVAKNRYERNQKNFAAVFNYATVIMSLECGEGCSCDYVQPDEAYRLLEEAKKLRPDYLPIYKQQDFLLMFKLFGAVWVGPGYSDEDAIAIYRARPDLARQRLAVQEKLLAAGQGDVYTAWQICAALNRTEKAAAYRKLVDAENAEYERQLEEARRVQAEELSKTFGARIRAVGKKISNFCRFGKCK